MLLCKKILLIRIIKNLHLFAEDTCLFYENMLKYSIEREVAFYEYL